MSVCERLNSLLHLLPVSPSGSFIPADMNGISSELGQQVLFFLMDCEKKKIKKRVDTGDFKQI